MMIDWKLGWNLAHIMSCAVEESLTWSLWFPEFVGNPKNKSPGPRPHFKGTDPQLPTSRAPGAGWVCSNNGFLGNYMLSPVA